ncbi:MAG: hypothetical protein HKO54_10765 [Flavobacteriaceae bacterium]|nr:hypothetical protein [Flavobacteriaceae bacterium]
MRKIILLAALLIMAVCAHAQNVQIDGRLQPLLNQFLDICKEYNVDYHDKLFRLESIDIVSTLTTSEHASTLGMLRRDENGEVVAIDISWMAQLDEEILKIVAFHEFAHYFLEYAKHTCDDCGEIMSVVNTSYFDIARDWENQVKILFNNAPVLDERYGTVVASRKYQYE